MQPVVRKFPNRDAFLQFIDEPRPSWTQGHASSDVSDSAAWDGGLNLISAKYVARFGNMDIGSLVEKRAHEIQPLVDEWACAEVLGREQRFDVVGTSVDLGRYIDRTPECLYQQACANIKKMINFCINVSASCGISGNDLAKKAAIIAAVTRALEIAGYAVAIDVIHSGHNGEYTHYTCVNVKTSDEYLSPDLIGFWCGHPAVLRRLFFAEMERWPLEDQRKIGVGNGYGSPWGIPDSLLEEYSIKTSCERSDDSETILEKLKNDFAKIRRIENELS